MYKKGLEMLKIFKNHNLKTSLLDDFMYYENRQKIMQEEKAKLLMRSFESPSFMPTLEPPRRLNYVVETPPVKDEKISKLNNDSNGFSETSNSSTGQNVGNPDVTTSQSVGDNAADNVAVDNEDISLTLKIGSVTITPKPVDPKPPAVGVANKEPTDVLTVGSMQVKVNGYAGSAGILKVGSIPLDPKALQLDKGGSSVKNASQR